MLLNRFNVREQTVPDGAPHPLAAGEDPVDVVNRILVASVYDVVRGGLLVSHELGVISLQPLPHL